MTKNRRRKQDARRQKAARAVSYTQALRETQSGTDAGELPGIPTPLPSLTDYTGGWKPGELITVGSRPGVGKSAFALDAAITALRAGRSVFFLSLELKAEELRLKMLSAMSSVPLKFVGGGGRTVAERDAFVRAERELESWSSRFTVAPWGPQTLYSIRAEALSSAQESGGFDLILIDQLEYIYTPGTAVPRYEATALLSRGLKSLAKELQLSVVLLVQLEREAEGSTALPTLSSIRSSSAIAMDSDSVILLHGDGKDSGAVQPLRVILAKHRAGEAGGVIDCEIDFSRVLIREAKPTVWELGEDGENWFIEGTTDPELAMESLLGWIESTEPRALEGYDEAEDELRQTFSTREDWFWLPLIAEDPDGELELCHLQKDRDRWTGQPLVRGIHAG